MSESICGATQEAEPAFKHLNRSMRWHYYAVPLKEEWLHVQVAPITFSPVRFAQKSSVASAKRVSMRT